MTQEQAKSLGWEWPITASITSMQEWMRRRERLADAVQTFNVHLPSTLLDSNVCKEEMQRWAKDMMGGSSGEDRSGSTPLPSTTRPPIRLQCCACQETWLAPIHMPCLKCHSLLVTVLDDAVKTPPRV